jgi:RND family efflux transporter MFP subunit
MRRFLFFSLIVVPSLTHAAVPVTTKPLRDVAVYPQVSVPASALSLNDSKVSAEVRAVILDVPAQVGQIVKEGDVLMRLDATDYQLAVQRAQAALNGVHAKLELAEFQLERAQKLTQQEAVSEELLKQRTAEVKSLQAELQAQQNALQSAQRDLKRCEIRAPFRAVVKERLAFVGELANPGMPLLRLLDVEHMEVSAKVQADDVESLQAAKTPQFSAQGKDYALRLRVVTAAYDPLERSREARLLFTGAAALPGAAGNLVWRDARAHVPADLLVRREGKLGVFIAESGKARFIALPEAQEGRPALANIAPDKPVIVDGRFSVKDGDEIAQP